MNGEVLGTSPTLTKINFFVIRGVKKKKSLGNDLLSQGAAPQVPSALADLTAGFGMLPGVPPPRISPRDCFHECELRLNRWFDIQVRKILEFSAPQLSPRPLVQLS